MLIILHETNQETFWLTHISQFKLKMILVNTNEWYLAIINSQIKVICDKQHRQSLRAWGHVPPPNF